MTPPWKLALGATLLPSNTVAFRVWAPAASRVRVKIEKKGKKPLVVPMRGDAEKYYSVAVENVRPGDRYRYVLDGTKERPDPVSRYQPLGVHGPSSVTDPEAYRWKDRRWKGLPLSSAIFYELHVGTFTREGTFEAAIKKLPYLKQLGVTFIELMPVSQFPGKRNWGYDGVGLYAVQNSYGGPAGLKKLVDACHRAGLGVCLDVVYNHFGPEGNYLHDFGPYFTKKYRTPWGDALNYDDSSCAGVREFIIQNAIYWATEYHVDALRLDAIHGIYDFGAKHILQELKDRVETQAKALGRRIILVAESDLNDSRIIRPKAQGGYGLDAQWSDDFHHAVHALLTGERGGYYADFGGLQDLSKAIRDGFVYDGVFSAFRKRYHGNSVKNLPRKRLVTSIQNHDQVGNRAYGDRLGTLLSFEKQKLAAAVHLLSPTTPLLFMGEEYGETAPFQYFIDHGDPALIRAVREGRKREFQAFGWTHVPDPADPATFASSRLGWTRRSRGKHRQLLALYRDLIGIRKKYLAGLAGDSRKMSAHLDDKTGILCLEYRGSGRSLFAAYSFSGEAVRWAAPFKADKILIDSDSRRYGGKPGGAGSGKTALDLSPWGFKIGFSRKK